MHDTGVENPARTEQQHKYENTQTSRAWHAVRDVAPEIQNLAKGIVNSREILCGNDIFFCGYARNGNSVTGEDPKNLGGFINFLLKRERIRPFFTNLL